MNPDLDPTAGNLSAPLEALAQAASEQPVPSPLADAGASGLSVAGDVVGAVVDGASVIEGIGDIASGFFSLFD